MCDYAGRLAILAALMFALFWVASDNLPDPSPPAASCSCAGREHCETAVFELEADRRAYCALWDGGQSCCMVVAGEAPDK